MIFFLKKEDREKQKKNISGFSHEIPFTSLKFLCLIFMRNIFSIIFDITEYLKGNSLLKSQTAFIDIVIYKYDSQGHIIKYHYKIRKIITQD